ncbi:MAG: triose-phosphate isomerase [Betaproteobacteria bacterium]|nr:triose-phosphate isomerase [Betaproteobacteria bacterium]
MNASNQNTKGRPLCFGNWKCNGSIAALRQWAADFDPGGAQAAVCVPYPYLSLAVQLLDKKAAVGCQDISLHAGGAHTGEVSAAMAADCGAQFTLVGHSECRQAGQDDKAVAGRIAQAVGEALIPVLCVGETLEQREAGKLEEVLADQLGAAAAELRQSRSPIVAYEPVWAIGTGRAASADDAQKAVGLVKGILKRTFVDYIPVLYGGSVKAANAAEYMAVDEIDGLLVGGASLKADEFSAICAAS